jgi:hypothetical protein
MKAYGGLDVNIHVFSKSTLFGDEWWRLEFPYIWYRSPGEHQNQSGLRGKEKIIVPTGTELRPLSPPARRQSLYRLYY